MCNFRNIWPWPAFQGHSVHANLPSNIIGNINRFYTPQNLPIDIRIIVLTYVVHEICAMFLVKCDLDLLAKAIYPFWRTAWFYTHRKQFLWPTKPTLRYQNHCYIPCRTGDICNFKNCDLVLHFKAIPPFRNVICKDVHLDVVADMFPNTFVYAIFWSSINNSVPLQTYPWTPKS